MLSVANKRHDIVAITITDPVELEIANLGLIKMFDPETGKDFIIDSSDTGARMIYAQNAQQRIKSRNQLFRSANVDSIDVRTDIAYSESLLKFFKARERRLR
jgi:hypothetical protein